MLNNLFKQQFHHMNEWKKSLNKWNSKWQNVQNRSGEVTLGRKICFVHFLYTII